jgi:hypothetical protein
MSTGLILRRVGTSPMGERWECEVRVNGVANGSLGSIACDGVRVALAHFVRLAEATELEATWVVGEGLTARLCRRFGLELRERAPGGGRKNLGEGRKVRRTYWLSPAGAMAIEAAAAASGRTLGEEIESRFLPS